uniref:Uncharacterized protein n=1 Tax=Heterorhabditis bacteriophora TaxID=37862 RepID=A0A1I7XGB2_HETBA
MKIININIVDVIGKTIYAAGSALAWALLGVRSESEDTVKHAAIEEQEREFHKFIREQIVKMFEFEFFFRRYFGYIFYYTIPPLK